MEKMHNIIASHLIPRYFQNVNMKFYDTLPLSMRERSM